MDELITCRCGQKYPLTKECCPYCGKALPRYWYTEDGELRSAVVFTRKGKQCVFADGRIYTRARDLPLPLKRFIKTRTFLAPLREMVTGFFRALRPVPPKWKEWIKGGDEDLFKSVKRKFEEEE